MSVSDVVWTIVVFGVLGVAWIYIVVRELRDKKKLDAYKAAVDAYKAAVDASKAAVDASALQVEMRKLEFDAKLTAHWISVAESRIAAGEDETEVLKDYGFQKIEEEN